MADGATYRVLGVDPGLNITGYGVVEMSRRGPIVIEAGTIRPDAKASMAARISHIHAELSEILAELKPQSAAVEKIYSHYAHPRTAILMAHARGAVLMACHAAGIAVQDLPATHVKKSLTGNGHASKLQVQRTVQAVFSLLELPQPPDVADALAIALCAARSL